MPRLVHSLHHTVSVARSIRQLVCALAWGCFRKTDGSGFSNIARRESVSMGSVGIVQRSVLQQERAAPEAALSRRIAAEAVRTVLASIVSTH